MALSDNENLDQATRNLLLEQQAELKKSHDQIKSLKDSENPLQQKV